MKSIGRESFLEDTIRKSIEKIAYERYHVDDCIVVFKNTKTGLEDIPFLHKQNTVLSLNEISRISFDLPLSQASFPIFFIYYSRETRIDNEQFNKEIGAAIARDLEEMLSSELLS
jgi:hypothetical protein